jgi:hypothetical protein
VRSVKCGAFSMGELARLVRNVSRIAPPPSLPNRAQLVVRSGRPAYVLLKQ